MGVLNNEAAEREANKIAFQFKDSNDVIRDMSRAYNTDFSNIRIHTDESADAKVRSAGRDAVASGNDIFFGRGIYESKDPASNALLAHELAHTMQQGSVMSEGAVSESAPMGAEQGGLISWFKNWRDKRKRRKAIKKGTFVHSDEERDAIMSDFKRPNLTTTNGKDWMKKNENGELVTVPKAASWPSDKKFIDSKFRDKWNYQRKMAMPRWYYSERPSEEAYGEMSELFPQMISDSDKSTTEEGALVNFGLRNTGFDVGKKHTELSEKIFDIDNYRNYFKAMSNGGIDYQAILDNSEEWIKPGFGSKIGISKEISEMSKDLMDLIFGNLKTNEGTEYLSFMLDGISGAKVFDQNKEDNKFTPMNYMLNTIFTNQIMKFNSIYQTMPGEDGTVDTNRIKVIMQATKNLQELPLIQRMSDDQRNALPSELKKLYRQYLILESQLKEKVNEFREQKTKK